jgi:hypothetical protein
VDEFKAKRQQAAQGPAQQDQSLEGTIYKGGQYRGPSGGVPPGLREPTDPEPPPAPPEDQAAGKRPSQTATLRFNDGSDGDFRGRAENVFVNPEKPEADFAFPFRLAGQSVTDRNLYLPGEWGLSAAKGRISLRIELPTDGDVYRFAQLGGADGVEFDADERGRGLLHGALAILFAAAAALVLRFRGRAKLAGAGN